MTITIKDNDTVPDYMRHRRSWLSDRENSMTACVAQVPGLRPKASCQVKRQVLHGNLAYTVRGVTAPCTTQVPALYKPLQAAVGSIPVCCEHLNTNLPLETDSHYNNFTLTSKHASARTQQGQT